LYDNGVEPTDNITFSVSRIYIMFGHNKIDLFDYIPPFIPMSYIPLLRSIL